MADTEKEKEIVETQAERRDARVDSGDPTTRTREQGSENKEETQTETGALRVFSRAGRHGLSRFKWTRTW